MIATSAQYKKFVYSRDYARHFIPEIVLKIIDTKARELSSYTADAPAFFNNFAQLTDENFAGSFDYGTLEDMQFLLNGTKRLMPDGALPDGQYGYANEALSDEKGIFNPPVKLTCSYSRQVTTVGRVYYFDANYDAVPKDFNLLYYRTGSLLKTVKVRNNEKYVYSSTVGVQNYDVLILELLATSKPRRRVHIIEDIPGIYMSYGSEEVVSMTLNQVVDIFCKDLVTGEVDFQIENAKKTLDILNPEGFEKYLQRRQPVDINLKMVFPDNTTETVPIGKLLLTDWKSQKGALTANFTARDTTDTLALDEYIKGSFYTTPRSLYEMAEEVLTAAKIEEYKIDIKLMNIYSTAPLPIATHKELLRLIAQAGQSVVLPTLTGGIHIKYVSPLVVAMNRLSNAAFDNGFIDWANSNCTLDATKIYVGKQSVKLNASGYISQNVATLTNKKIYFRCYVNPQATLTTGSAYVTVNDVRYSANLAAANLQVDKWTPISFIFIGQANNTVKLLNNTTSFNADCFMMIDLTLTYGAGNEPTLEWCDANIRFFSNMLPIPRVKDPAATDTFDYGILLDAPEISTSTPIKSVETNIYSYKEASGLTEVYKGARFIQGTEEFTIKFSSPAKGCTIKVESLDSSGAVTTPNTAVLVSSSLYAQAAVLKVTAVGEVQVIVQGKAVSVQTSQFKIDSSLDTNLVDDAKAESIDNKLITSKTVAEDVTSYAAYWYNRRYTYNFDWRQNPAVEVLDTVTVFDDFSRNNDILLTERNVDYSDGVLGGSSKGVF